MGALARGIDDCLVHEPGYARGVASRQKREVGIRGVGILPISDTNTEVKNIPGSVDKQVVKNAHILLTIKHQ